jgi:hypothetical protein
MMLGNLTTRNRFTAGYRRTIGNNHRATKSF